MTPALESTLERLYFLQGTRAATIFLARLVCLHEIMQGEDLPSEDRLCQWPDIPFSFMYHWDLCRKGLLEMSQTELDQFQRTLLVCPHRHEGLALLSALNRELLLRFRTVRDAFNHLPPSLRIQNFKLSDVG